MAKRKPVDEELLKKLAAMHCTYKEMANCLNVSVDTLERRYADLIEKHKSMGRSKLRGYQWESASNGNVTMLIWLGKQYLDQREKIDQHTELDVGEGLKELKEQYKKLLILKDETLCKNDKT